MGDPASQYRGGRVNVGVAALLMVATLPGRSHGLGLLTRPLLADFDIRDVTFGQINLWASLLGAAFCLPCGRLIDRYGIRPVLVGVVFGLGGSVLALANVHAVALLAVVLLLVRGFGQSALSVVSLGVVGKTAFRHRERAMAGFAVLVGVGFAAAVGAVRAAEENPATHWRDVWSWMAYALLFAVLPLSFALVREPASATPLDGGPDPQAIPSDDNGGFTLGEALRTPAFWAVALSCSLFLFVSSGTALFYEDILAGFGFGRSEYESLLGVSFLLGTLFNLLCGWLAQRYSLTRLLGSGSLVMAAALVLLPFARTMTQLYVYAAAVACSGGVVTVVFFIAWRPMFGPTHVGQIQGAAQLLTVVASAVSQWLFPAGKNWFGSYVPLLDVLAGAALVLGTWVWVVRPPRRSLAPGP